MEELMSLNILKKYRAPILGIVAVFIGIGLASAYLIKPVFKVSSVISISPSYFQNSLVREFLSEVYDPTELRSQRQSILAEALDRNFLDAISGSTGLVRSDETMAEAALRRANLLRSIEIIPLQSSDFQISVSGQEREKAMVLNQKVIENILTVLKEKRTKTLSALKSAIATQIDTMTPTIGLINGNSMNAEALKSRISILENTIAQQKEILSSSHPAMQEQNRKLAELKKMFATAEASGTTDVASDYDSTPTAGATPGQNTVYEDLNRKYRYLNIVMLAESSPQPAYFSVVRSPEYPLSQIWPKKGLFLIWAFLLGVLVSLFYVAAKELPSLKTNLENKKQQKYNMTDLDFFEGQRKAPSATTLDHDIQP